MNFLSGAVTYFREGGPFMYAILACGVFIVAIVAERIVVIGRAAMTDGHRLADEIARALGRGDSNAARKLALASDAPVAKVAAAMLDAGHDEAAVQTAADDAATLSMPALARRLAHLNMLANVATLLGLLGTIFGLTTAFLAVGAADPAQRSAFLAAGIAQALNTTAFGLMVAVPALVAHGWLVGMVEGVADQVDAVTIKVATALARQPSAGTHLATGTTGPVVHSMLGGR